MCILSYLDEGEVEADVDDAGEEEEEEEGHDEDRFVKHARPTERVVQLHRTEKTRSHVSTSLKYPYMYMYVNEFVRTSKS